MTAPAVTDTTPTETGSTSTESAEAQATTTPSTTQSTTAAPSTNGPNPDELRAALAAMNGNIVREQAQTIVDLQRQLAERNATPTTPPADDAARFLEAPRQMIREELQSVVAPLLDYMQGVKKVSAYDQLKNEAKRNPAIASLLIEVESTVDQLMANNEPTPQNLQVAIFTAQGMKNAGLIGSPAAPAPTTSPTTQPSAPVSNPPYIPPSPPAPPRSANTPADTMKAKIAALTETEREVIRKFNMTPEQYIINRDADENATSWKGGTNV